MVPLCWEGSGLGGLEDGLLLVCIAPKRQMRLTRRLSHTSFTPPWFPIWCFGVGPSRLWMSCRKFAVVGSRIRGAVLSASTAAVVPLSHPSIGIRGYPDLLGFYKMFPDSLQVINNFVFEAILCRMEQQLDL